MGRRARQGGISNAAVRAARAAFLQHDDDAAAVAQRVYNAVAAARDTGEAGEISPLLHGPVVVVAEQCALVVVRSSGLPETEEMVGDVAAYFYASIMAGVQLFDFAHFEEWRRRTDGDEEAAGG